MYSRFILILSLCCLACCNLFSKELVDIVYTWVDGSDPDWQAIRDRYVKEWAPFLNSKSNSKNRYRNRDELKYSLRSVAEFAPFVNHIYIVTFGQTPKWLQSHPKISIIDHTEIFQNQNDLPTFNSQAIECHLHRIPNLSEKYIYLNDDVMFCAPITIADFFTRDGQIIVYKNNHKISPDPVSRDDSAYDCAVKNTNTLLNTHFGFDKRYKLAHAAFAFTRSIVNEVEYYFPHIFQFVSSHKFRMPTDYTMTNGLIQYFALYTGKAQFIYGDVPLVRILSDMDYNARSFAKVERGRHKIFCIQDSSPEDNPVVDQQVEEFFQELFPVPAPWEKDLTIDPLPKKK